MNNNGKGSWLENRDAEIHNTPCIRGRNSHKTKKKQLCFKCLLWTRAQGLSLHVSQPHLPLHCPLKEQFPFTHQLLHSSSGWTCSSWGTWVRTRNLGRGTNGRYSFLNTPGFQELHWPCGKGKIWMLELPSFEFNNLLCYQLFWDISCLSYKIGIVIATPWTVAYQAPPSMGFSRQEYGSGLPFPSPGDLPDTEIEPRSPTL